MNKAQILRELKELKQKYLAESTEEGYCKIYNSEEKANKEINNKYGKYWRKSKFHQEIASLKPHLIELADGDKKWMLQNVLYHKIYALKNGEHSCMDCGHQWHPKQDPTTLAAKLLPMECPSCKTQGNVELTRKRKYNDEGTCKKINTYKGYQIISIYNVIGVYKVGKPKWTNIILLSHTIIDPKTHKFLVWGKSRNAGYGYYVGNWTGETMLRDKHVAWNNDIDTYKTLPRKNVIKELKMRGYRHTHHVMNTFEYMFNLLTYPQFETLVKSRRIDFLNSYSSKGNKIIERWSTVKLCIKFKYYPKHIGDYLDYLDLLAMFDRDLHSPKYIFPENLHKEHQRYIEKKREYNKKQAIISQRLKLLEDQERFAIEKKDVIGFSVDMDGYNIRTLNSVKEYDEEATELKHCAYTNAYYDKESSFCLSVSKDGKKIETVEFNFKKRTIEQSRGWDNKNSKHHKKIVNIAKKLIPQIMDHILRNVPKKKKKTNKLKQVA